VTNLTVYDML